MRTTLHLVTAEDALALHPVMLDVLRRAWRSSPFAKALGDVELEPMLAAAREVLEAHPTSPADLATALGARWPDRDANAMAYLARFLLPLVQVPPRGLWRQTSRATNTTLEAWTGRQPAAASLDDIVLRYLRAFGPATSGDVRTWSWLTGLRPVLERLRPRLRIYRDEAGRELFDVEDGVIADPATPGAGPLPAPVRQRVPVPRRPLAHQRRDDLGPRLRLEGRHPGRWRDHRGVAGRSGRPGWRR